MDQYNIHCLLTVEQMAEADAIAVSTGISSELLMEVAGKAVANVVLENNWGPITVLCGPGNNGGDGFVAARYLREAGKEVRLGLLGSVTMLRGDAKANYDRWTGRTELLSPELLHGSECVVDAIFGAGLSREIVGPIKNTIAAIGDRYCVAVDMPSGIEGNTGRILGIAPKANKTITFFRFKPGHFLFPGRENCGDIILADIGIPERILSEVAPRHWRNHPEIWINGFKWPKPSDHKYSRGHAIIVGGSEMTGAARLAVQSAMRAGVGIVSAIVPKESELIYKLSLPGAIIRSMQSLNDLSKIVEWKKDSTAYLIGPGNGVTLETREIVCFILGKCVPTVLDADAISVFENDQEVLSSIIKAPCLITPHEGEFTRVFNFAGDKIYRARRAAKLTGATVLLKGADTVIASPDGRVVINDNAPFDLATAGTGDVLAGFAVALMAKGIDPFEAGCMAVWLHGEAARSFGPGLIAEDLPGLIPTVLNSLKKLQLAN